MKKLLSIVLCALLLSLPNGTEAASLKVTGGWPSLTVGSLRDMPLRPSLEQVRLSILGAEPSENWILRVGTRGAPPESSGIRLERRRAGEATGMNRVKGGQSFVPVGSDRHVLLRGRGDRFDIPLELKVSLDPKRIGSRIFVLNIIFELEDSK